LPAEPAPGLTRGEAIGPAPPPEVLLAAHRAPLFVAQRSRLCVNERLPSVKGRTVSPCPSSLKRVVTSPSTPTGPRAWMREVLMPTSSPAPNRYTVEYLVHALFTYSAASTTARL